MQIQINDKTYDTDTMTPEAVGLVNKMLNAQANSEAFQVAGEAYGQALVKILESNKPIEIEQDVEDTSNDE